MRKLRICFFIASLRQGGAERVVAGLCDTLKRNGHEICIITLHKETPEDYKIPVGVRRIDLNLIRHSTSYFDALYSNWKRLDLLRRQIKKESPDIIVSFLTTNNVLILLATFRLKIPVIISERIYPLYAHGTRLWLLLRPKVYKLASSTVVQSSEGKKWLRMNTWAKDIVVIPNSIPWPPSRYHPEVKPCDYVTKSKKLILAVGRINPQKGFADLLKAFSIVALKNADWELAIIGEGDTSDLEEDMVAYGLTERVHLVSRVGNVEDWYNRAEIFVLSSYYEGFPNVLVEGMAAGCAVLSYDCLTGPRDLIDHGKNGMLVEVGNIEQLSESLCQLVCDETLRKKLGLAGTEVKERYRPEKIDVQWENLMHQVLDSNRTS